MANLKALEELIRRGATEGERAAAKKAWERHAGRPWTDEPPKAKAKAPPPGGPPGAPGSPEFIQWLRDMLSRDFPGGPGPRMDSDIGSAWDRMYDYQKAWRPPPPEPPPGPGPWGWESRGQHPDMGLDELTKFMKYHGLAVADFRVEVEPTYDYDIRGRYGRRDDGREYTITIRARKYY